MTQALVLSNEEIWKHCQCYLDQEKVACCDKNELPFKRFGFNKVIVETTPDKPIPPLAPGAYLTSGHFP